MRFKRKAVKNNARFAQFTTAAAGCRGPGCRIIRCRTRPSRTAAGRLRRRIRPARRRSRRAAAPSGSTDDLHTRLPRLTSDGLKPGGTSHSLCGPPWGRLRRECRETRDARKLPAQPSWSSSAACARPHGVTERRRFRRARIPLNREVTLAASPTNVTSCYRLCPPGLLRETCSGGAAQRASSCTDSAGTACGTQGCRAA